jgi:hypothetical protein
MTGVNAFVIGLPGVIATKAAGMDASAWAAWVQAVFSVLAICAGFLTMYLQNRHADKAREAERARGAEVVAYRLSGWIADAGVRLEMALRTCQDRQSKVSSGPPRSLPVVIDELRLNMPSGIEAVLPDLHYLLLGSGDVAQLDHNARGYEAWLDGTLKINTQPGGGPSMIAAYSLRDIYTRAEKQLTAMKALHANAQRHIGPLIEQAIKRDGGEVRVDP